MTNIAEVAIDPELDSWPVYDQLVAEGVDPFAYHLFYEGLGGVQLDALDRTPPDPWWPGDLHSVAGLIAADLGDTYTGYTRRHADEMMARIRREEELERADETRRIEAQRAYDPLTSPTLLGLQD